MCGLPLVGLWLASSWPLVGPEAGSGLVCLLVSGRVEQSLDLVPPFPYLLVALGRPSSHLTSGYNPFATGSITLLRTCGVTRYPGCQVGIQCRHAIRPAYSVLRTPYTSSTYGAKLHSPLSVNGRVWGKGRYSVRGTNHGTNGLTSYPVPITPYFDEYSLRSTEYRHPSIHPLIHG